MANARPYRVALNGYGRIGRCVLRAFYERGAASDFQFVALNDLADMASVEYLTRFDSTHGRFPGEVGVAGDCLHLNGDCVKVLRESTPEAIDWRALGATWCSNVRVPTTPVPVASAFLPPVRRACCSRSRWPAPPTSMPRW